MSISRVGTSTGTNTAAPVTHAIGDLIVIAAFRNTTGTPSLPAGYTSILTKTGTTSSMRVGFKIATATNDAGGTWTNATSTVCHVYRSSLYSTGGSLYIGASASNSATVNTVNYPALTLIHGDNTSWVLGFGGVGNLTETIATAPSGMTNESLETAAATQTAGHDTNGTVSSWSSTNAVTTGTAGNSVSATVELIENQPGAALANIVQHISFAYNDTNATGELNNLYVFPFDHTLAGNGLAFALVYPSGLTPTITDDKGNTWPASPEVIADPGAGTQVLAFWHINNATTGTSQINVSFGSSTAASVKAWVTQLFNVTGTVESTSAWKLVATAPAAGILSPGSQTPSVANCLVLSYMALSANNVGTNPALIVAETGYNLNDADISWGTNGIPNASQYALQTTATATTPRFYLNAGGTADTYNVISIALSTGLQGTAKPSGAGVAPWLDRILHFGTNSTLASWLLQIPCTGNAIVCRGLLSDTGVPHLTSLNDNDGGSYTLTQPGGTGTLYIPNRVNIPTGRSNRTMTVGISATGSNMQWIVADVSNCDTAPIAASAGTPTNSTTNTTIPDQPDITPTATNQLTLAYQQLGVGPYWGVSVPTGAVLELPFASIWQGTASIAGTSLTVTATAWGTPGVLGSPILSDAGAHVAGGITLVSGTGPFTLSASQGTVASETMFLSSSDVNTMNWGNASAHYFNVASLAQQQWTWGIAQQPGGGGGFGVALILAGPPAGASLLNPLQFAPASRFPHGPRRLMQPNAAFLPQGIFLTSDSGAPFEFLSNLRNDALALLEYLASIRADSVAQLEAIAGVRRDDNSLPEFVAGLSANVASQLEFLGSMRGDNLGPLETASALRSDVIVLMETLSGTRSDIIAASEIVAGLRADLIGPLEITGAFRSDYAVQIETTGAFRSDATAPLEIAAGVRYDAAVPTEILGGVRGDSAVPMENQGAIGVTGNAAVQLETTAKLNFDQAANVETISAARSDVATGTEFLAGAARQSTGNIESIAGRQSDSAAQVEFAGAIGVTGNASIPIEMVSKLQGDAIIDQEVQTGVSVTASAPVPIEVTRGFTSFISAIIEIVQITAKLPLIRQLVAGRGDKSTVSGSGDKTTVMGSGDKTKFDGKPY